MNSAGSTNLNRDCRADFEQMAVAYRKRKLLMVIVGWIAFPFWLLIAFVPPARGIGFIGFLACVTILFFGGIAFWRLSCPGCQNNIDGSEGRFCPKCGAHSVERGFWNIGSPKCRVCEKRMAKGRGGRRYKIRYCRECGAYLDSQGL
jgi:hypothetical protein